MFLSNLFDLYYVLLKKKALKDKKVDIPAVSLTKAAVCMCVCMCVQSLLLGCPELVLSVAMAATT